MPPTAYDLIPYRTFPRPQTHAERLAAVGRLFGMQPAPVEACRVLEIGCGDGGNLIPMACALAGSRFTGIDRAAAPIESASRMAADLGLANITLRAADLREIDDAWGDFDYILAHGVYSWVPEEVREGLLALCGQRLAPAGIALISYNAYPGGHIRQMLREMMLYHTRLAETAAGRIAPARELLEMLYEVRRVSPAWQALREIEFTALLERDDAELYHDELNEWNERFYFHEFAAAARRHGLEYLGEAEPHEMFDAPGLLGDFEGDIVEFEQYLDFFKARRFRQTLLCRQEAPIRRQTSPEQMEDFLFSAPARRLDNGRIEGARGISISAENEAAARVALALGEVDPLPLLFDDLVPYAGSPEALGEILYEFLVVGFADLHVFDFPCEDSVTERPRASRLARYQAERTSDVTSACHMVVHIDDLGLKLLRLLDGTRTHDQLAADLQVENADALLRPSLQWMAAHGLLEG